MTRDEGKRGGMVLRVQGSLFFLPAAATLGITPMPRVTAVPGASADLVGIAVFESAIVPVVSIGSPRGEMIVCRYAGEPLGLVGGEVVRTGIFESGERPGSVEFAGRVVDPLDISSIYSNVEARMRRGRWGGSES